VISDFNPSNAEMLLADIDLVMDGTDNYETHSFILRLKIGKVGMTLFNDGRAIIKNIENENKAKAKALYAEYFGL